MGLFVHPAKAAGEQAKAPCAVDEIEAAEEFDYVGPRARRRHRLVRGETGLVGHVPKRLPDRFPSLPGRAAAQPNDVARDILEHRGELQMRSEEHTSELQSQMRTSSAGFCLKKHTTTNTTEH